MIYRSKIAALACVGIVSIGIVGCGDNNDVEAAMEPKEASEALGQAIAFTEIIEPMMEGASSEGQSNIYEGTKRVLGAFNVSQKIPRETEEGGVGVQDCLYGGTMTVATSESHDDVDGIWYDTYDYNITFDNCVDEYPVIEDLMMGGLQPENEQFAHNGSLHLSVRETATPRETYTDSFAMEFTADDLTLERMRDGEVRERLSANLSAGFVDLEREYDEEEFSGRVSLHADGQITMEEFDGEDTFEWKFEAREFAVQLVGHEENMPRGTAEDGSVSMVFSSDGYLGTSISIDGEVEESGHLETDGFEAVWNNSHMVPDIASTEITTESYNGLFGTSCMESTVTFNTAAEGKWVTNSEQQDISGEYGGTPGQGTTTVTGADGMATVNFDTNGTGYAYGTITAGGETTEPMTRAELLTEPEECEIFIGPWLF